MATQSIIVWSKKGCSYCAEVKDFLQQNQLDYKEIDVTEHDEFRDILNIKYGIRHVPVVEIGAGHSYEAVTKVGLEHLKIALAKTTTITEDVQ